MLMFIILGVVVLLTLCIFGFLFYVLSKEGQKKEEEKVVPLTDLAQLKKDLSNQLFEQNDLKVIEKDNEIIPVFEQKTAIDPESSASQEPPLAPVEETQSFLEPSPSPEDEAYKKRAQQLEDELLAISNKAAGQSDEAQQLIETLTKENESLKSQKADLEQAQQKLAQLQDEAANLKTENINLQSQLESTDAKVHFLENEMAAVKIQMAGEIAQANATISELNREKEAVLPVPTPQPDEGLRTELEALKAEHIQLNQRYEELQRIHLAAPKIEPDEGVHQELEILKADHIQLKQKCDDLEKVYEELKSNNAQLVENNDLVQYELVKAKAQSSGLERVSFNYKNQLEDFFKKVNAVQVTNDHLSQVKNRLEGMVEEMKSQNEELVKKDHLSQFELEQNRSRLISLEREYEDLKARLQQQNQQQ